LLIENYTKWKKLLRNKATRPSRRKVRVFLVRAHVRGNFAVVSSSWAPSSRCLNKLATQSRLIAHARPLCAYLKRRLDNLCLTYAYSSYITKPELHNLLNMRVTLPAIKFKLHSLSTHCSCGSSIFCLRHALRF